VAQIIVSYHVLCDSESTANKVLSEFFPSADTMVGVAGILGVKAEWVADKRAAETFQEP
jgi:hypothetical protein